MILLCLALRGPVDQHGEVDTGGVGVRDFLAQAGNNNVNINDNDDS